MTGSEGLSALGREGPGGAAPLPESGHDAAMDRIVVFDIETIPDLAAGRALLGEAAGRASTTPPCANASARAMHATARTPPPPS